MSGQSTTTLYEVIGTDPKKAQLKIHELPKGEELPENKNGIVKISIVAYGDAPEVPLIKVEALSKIRALRAYKRAYAIYSGHVFDE